MDQTKLFLPPDPSELTREENAQRVVALMSFRNFVAASTEFEVAVVFQEVCKMQLDSHNMTAIRRPSGTQDNLGV